MVQHRPGRHGLPRRRREPPARDRQGQPYPCEDASCEADGQARRPREREDVGRPRPGRTLLCRTEGPDAADGADHRPRARQGDHHARRHRLQQEAMVLARQPEAARRMPGTPIGRPKAVAAKARRGLRTQSRAANRGPWQRTRPSFRPQVRFPEVSRCLSFGFPDRGASSFTMAAQRSLLGPAAALDCREDEEPARPGTGDTVGGLSRRVVVLARGGDEGADIDDPKLRRPPRPPPIYGAAIASGSAPSRFISIHAEGSRGLCHLSSSASWDQGAVLTMRAFRNCLWEVAYRCAHG